MNEDLQRKLNASLPRDAVKTREQAGQRLSYVDGHYAITRANEVFGHDGWSYRPRAITEVYRGDREGRGAERNIVIIYEASVEVTALGVTREDVGIGVCDAGPRALIQSVEKARKEAVTDGLKRALKSFGPSFGLALYDKNQRDVGLSTAALAMVADVEALETAADVTAWAHAHADAVKRLDADEQDVLRGTVAGRRRELAVTDVGTRPTEPAPLVDALSTFGRFEQGLLSPECTTLAHLTALWGAASQGLAAAEKLTAARDLVYGYLEEHGYDLTTAEVTLVLGNQMNPALCDWHDKLARAEGPEGAVDCLRSLPVLTDDEVKAAKRAVSRIVQRALTLTAKAAGEWIATRLRGDRPTPPDDGPGSGTRAPAATQPANGNGASVASATATGAPAAKVTPLDREYALARSPAGWTAHLLDIPFEGEDRGAGHVAGSYWKREAAFRRAGTHAQMLAITVDELARRGIAEPSPWLDGVGERNGATSRRRAA